ncbi:MAG: hypothetical protein AB7R55_08535 [Gemmatimonadales bacterium]
MKHTASAKPVVAVLRLGRLEAAGWGGIAQELGLPLVETDSVAEWLDSGPAAVRLIASGVTELRAVDTLRSGSLGGVMPAVVGSDPGHRTAVALLSAGATEYFVLPQDGELLLAWIRAQASRFGDRTVSEAPLDQGAAGSRDDGPPGAGPPVGVLPFPATMREITQRAASAMVERCRGNKSEAARRLAISRTRLLRLLAAGARRETPAPEYEAPDHWRSGALP